ncbi:hypothetical protein Clacol_006380 [Clathrus columnatus]|uniref:Rab-GAP TBC domain-containing protein n=1 Tax=Clathrus columnatus TaxID=1419009 RepID=A0AAV5AG43_9AGAM|nr:hypothetical protein Clacol_006380 [Clathrus columnatus]
MSQSTLVGKEELISSIPVSSFPSSYLSYYIPKPLNRLYDKFYQWRVSLGLPNPGPVENLQKEARTTLLTNFAFEGGRADIGKVHSVNPFTFHTTHAISLGSQTAPPSYTFGTAFANANLLMTGSVDNEGNVNARFNQMWTANNATKLQAQLSKREDHNMIQLEQDYQGLDYSANIKAMNPGLTDFTGVYIANYLQSVTKNLALGLETVFQRSTPEMEETSTSYLIRYAGTNRNWLATAHFQTIGVLQATYWQKLSEKVEVAADLQMLAAPTRRDAVATLGAKYDLRMASFRAQVDSTGKVSAYLEQRLAPTLAFLLSGEVDHFKNSAKFGVGVTIEMSSLTPEEMEAQGSESMVEIKRSHMGKNSDSEDEPFNHRLLYSKSKVYVNPTPYTRDNIPGFVALVKREGRQPSYLLAWIPESLLNEKGSDEWDKFLKMEEKPVVDEDEDGIFIDPPVSKPEYYTFSVPLSSIYSLSVIPPSLSSWYGTVTINLIRESTLPTLHFHDDESRSIHLPAPSYDPSSYPPSYPPSNSRTSWGGESLISALRPYANILRSTLDSTLFLVDPSRQDMEVHSAVLFADDAIDSITSSSSSPIPVHRRPRPLTSPPSINLRSRGTSILHASLAPQYSSTSILQSFSNITRSTRHAAQRLLSHPLAKPILPHLPDPVRSLVNANGEWSSWVEKGGLGEFESARVYLAKWAKIVAEEGERSRLRESLPSPSGGVSVNDAETPLGIFELIQSTSRLPIPRATRNPRHPIDKSQWDAWFAEDGRPKVRMDEMRAEVFRRGITPNMRQTIWPYLLGVMPWDMSSQERKEYWKEKRLLYDDTYHQWFNVAEVFNREDIVEERHRIDVDCRRTDRSHPMFSSRSDSKTTNHRKHTSISPNVEDFGAQSPSNEHVERLASILLTYNFFEKDLGYVQGMSDLCAPIYVVMEGDQEMTFWCFVSVMERMVSILGLVILAQRTDIPNFVHSQKKNFLRDQSEKVDGLNLFFCFRWILIAFKREFPIDDILRLWEVLWSDYYTSQFVLFVALALLVAQRDVILRYLVEFDEILKAEVLFLSFSQLVMDIDRRLQESPDDIITLRNRKQTTTTTTNKSESLPLISENLRELLKRSDVV